MSDCGNRPSLNASSRYHLLRLDGQITICQFRGAACLVNLTCVLVFVLSVVCRNTFSGYFQLDRRSKTRVVLWPGIGPRSTRVFDV